MSDLIQRFRRVLLDLLIDLNSSEMPRSAKVRAAFDIIDETQDEGTAPYKRHPTDLLRHIQVGKCPLCGAPPIEERIATRHISGGKELLVHTNGERGEERKFLCGLQASWVPNYSAVRWSYLCMNSEEVKLGQIEWEKQVKAARAFLMTTPEGPLRADLLSRLEGRGFSFPTENCRRVPERVLPQVESPLLW